MLQALLIGVPGVTGLYAIRSGHAARFGYLLIASGAFWSLSALAESPASVPYSIGRVAAWLIFPLLVYLLLAFPDGRLEGGIDRKLFRAVALVVGLLYVGSAAFVEAYPLYTPWASCRADCPQNAFLVVDAEPAIMGSVVEPVREALAIALLAAVTLVLAHGMRVAPRLRRQMLAPVVAMSALSCALLAAFYVTRRASEDVSAIDTVGLLWGLTVPATAAAFGVGLVRRRLLMATVLGQLSRALSKGERRDLRDVLATALDDATIEVLFPDAAPARWRDRQGHLTSVSAFAGPERAVTRISDDGTPLAAVVHDATLRGDEELIEAVSSLVLSSLRHDRLTSRLAKSLAELEESRKRIATVADLERSRIERDLHDGAQQRLILLRVKLSLAEELLRVDPPAGAKALAELGAELDGAIDALRSVAHGVYPAVLSDRGLEDALRSAVIASPLPVRLEARGVGRHPPEIETAVYFTCLEALQNALKHAQGASGVWVTLRQNRTLKLEVADDGPGFVPPSPIGDGGLRNMRDRLEAIGGRLTIDAAPGQGTRIRGTVPLG
jgi:signal transduction histidine kinase